MRDVLSTLARIADSPYVNLFAGLLLIIASLLEATDTVLEQIIGVDMRLYHGILILGLFQVARSLIDLLAGFERIGRKR